MARWPRGTAPSRPESHCSRKMHKMFKFQQNNTKPSKTLFDPTNMIRISCWSDSSQWHDSNMAFKNQESWTSCRALLNFFRRNSGPFSVGTYSYSQGAPRYCPQCNLVARRLLRIHFWPGQPHTHLDDITFSKYSSSGSRSRSSSSSSNFFVNYNTLK